MPLLQTFNLDLVHRSANGTGGLFHAVLPVANNFPIGSTMSKLAGLWFETTPDVVQVLFCYFTEWEFTLENKL